VSWITLSQHRTHIRWVASDHSICRSLVAPRLDRVVGGFWVWGSEGKERRPRPRAVPREIWGHVWSSNGQMLRARVFPGYLNGWSILSHWSRAPSSTCCSLHLPLLSGSVFVYCNVNTTKARAPWSGIDINMWGGGGGGQRRVYSRYLYVEQSAHGADSVPCFV
jgi:hypothetical protein